MRDAEGVVPYEHFLHTKKHRRMAVLKTYTFGGVNVLNGGSYHNYKRCNIYMKQISEIFVTFGGTLAFGEGKGI